MYILLPCCYTTLNFNAIPNSPVFGVSDPISTPTTAIVSFLSIIMLLPETSADPPTKVPLSTEVILNIAPCCT